MGVPNEVCGLMNRCAQVDVAVFGCVSARACLACVWAVDELWT